MDFKVLIACFLLMIVVLSPVACTMHKNYGYNQIMKSSTDHIAAACAIQALENSGGVSTTTVTSPVCVIKASQK
jgi:hypothetical protein